jgi:uncharacterized membrane protein YfhO
LNVTEISYGNYSFSSINKTAALKLQWDYRAPKDGLYMMYGDVTDGDDLTVLENDMPQSKKYGMGRSYIASIGYFSKGDKISVSASPKAGASGTAKIYVDVLNADVFEQGYNKLKTQVLKAEKSGSNNLEGKINVTEDGLFYTSIPYEDGWTAVVDGEKTEITPVGNAMLAFPITKGEHTVSLYYYPKGFWIGFAASTICVMLLVGMCLLTYVFRKKIIPEPAALDIPEVDEE